MNQIHYGKVKSNQEGFTLIEILIAITIFAIGMLAVGSMQVSGIQGNATAKGLTGASLWAADRIEKLMPLDYEDAMLDPAGNPHGPVSVDGGRYAIEWQVTQDLPVVNIKAIKITVSWQDRNRNKSLDYNFYKADL